MPFINTKLNMSLNKNTELLLKEEFGKAIELFPGKSEEWLMLSFEDNCRLWFKGEKNVPIVWIEVFLFGPVNSRASEAFTQRITSFLHQKLEVEPSNIYIKYSTADQWGWNGRNF